MFALLQDFELEIAGAHMMKVQVCSKSLLKEETCAHGKIRVREREGVWIFGLTKCSHMYGVRPS